MTTECDVAEERQRPYKHKLFDASSEVRHADRLGPLNDAGAPVKTADAPARENLPGTPAAAIRSASVDLIRSAKLPFATKR
ncbi:hypothetical protein ACJ51O_35945 (plasmid) [Burkholderia pyrrocinia]|uniref:hypothetical protein n=1 Tax=Burkholderia pyrrocinia TaxID=60550 RepID=UPI0038B5827E